MLSTPAAAGRPGCWPPLPAAATVCIVPPFLLGAMAVQVRDDLGFSESGTGLAVGAFFAVASLLSAPLGRWSERVGGGRALRVAAVWAAAGQLLLAVGARSLVLLIVLNAFAGGANALGQPAANLLIARAVPANRQGLGFAVKQAAIPFSTFLAGLAVPSIALTAGWRWAYVAAAGLALVAAVGSPGERRGSTVERSVAGRDGGRFRAAALPGHGGTGHRRRPGRGGRRHPRRLLRVGRASKPVCPKAPPRSPSPSAAHSASPSGWPPGSWPTGAAEATCAR